MNSSPDSAKAASLEQELGAAFVEVTFSLDDKQIAKMVYTGPSGGANSDPEKYWALLGKPPQSAYEVKIKPIMDNAKTANLQGKIKISIKLRNKFNMGIVKTNQLQLVRSENDVVKWFLPAKELKRIQKLVKKD